MAEDPTGSALELIRAELDTVESSRQRFELHEIPLSSVRVETDFGHRWKFIVDEYEDDPPTVTGATELASLLVRQRSVPERSAIANRRS